LERLFEVDYDDNDSIATLKKKVKEKKQISLSANKLTVWQCKEPKLLVDVNANKLEATLKKVDLFDYKKIVELAEAMMVISLELCKYKILLV